MAGVKLYAGVWRRERWGDGLQVPYEVVLSPGRGGGTGWPDRLNHSLRSQATVQLDGIRCTESLTPGETVTKQKTKAKLKMAVKMWRTAWPSKGLQGG